MSANLESKRLMAIDPGSKHIGIALSDLSGTIAQPFCIINHNSRENDAIKILQVAQQYQVVKIIMGLSMDEEGNPSPVGRRAKHLAEEIINQNDLPIEYWDEDSTTNLAQETILQVGISKNRRKGHHDDLAAAVLLQSYIENTKFNNLENPK